MIESEQDAFLELIAAYQDGSLSAAEVAEFESQLLSDTERRRLFIEVQICSAEIAEHCRAAAFALNQSQALGLAKEGRLYRRKPDWRIVATLAVAATLVVATLLPVLRDQRKQASDAVARPTPVVPTGPPREDIFATVTYANRAILRDAQSDVSQVGAELMPHVRYRLTSGSVRLRVSGGAIVSLAAPATFQGLGPAAMELKSGKLAARLPNEEADLVVRSGGTIMRDLGTAFGVTAKVNGEVDLSVFDGMVSVEHSKGSGESKRHTVTEGESIVTDGGSAVSRDVAYAAMQYQDIWPLTVGVNDASSLIEFVKPGPIESLDRLASDDKLLLIPEKLNHHLRQNQSLQLMRPGSSWPKSKGERTGLAKTRSISSYLLVYLPKDRENVPRHSLSGSVAFQKPIIGVAVVPSALKKSDKMFGISDIDYQSLEMRSLEPLTTEDGLLPPDSVQVSKDGKYLYFNLYVGAGQDNIRVLVDEDEP